MKLAVLAAVLVGCSHGVPDPLPASRDGRLVGRWAGQVGPGIPTFIDLDPDGTGSVSLDYDPGEKKIWTIQWGTDKGSLCLARPTTDTGLSYEATPFQLSANGKKLEFVGRVENYFTYANEGIRRSTSNSRLMTAVAWHRK